MKFNHIVVAAGLVCSAGLSFPGLSAAETGLVVRSFADSETKKNVATIIETRYVGQCPGTDYTYPEAWFVSDKTPVGSGLRVKVQNVTPGMNQDPYPYTDRGYSSGVLSEHTFLSLDTKHRGRTFSVQSGDNTLQYTIAKGSQVVETGSFNLKVDLLSRVENRPTQCTLERRCYPTPAGVQCETYWECRCPR
jgi:hypothetical protein